jgi:Flp pilus assembly protein TadG
MKKYPQVSTNEPHPKRPFLRFFPWQRNKSAGQSIVEFALAAPLLLLVIFGIIDIARLIQAQVTVNNAARQAVRYAITGYQERDASGNYIPRSTTIISTAVRSLAGLPIAQTSDPQQFGFYKVEINPTDAGDPNQVVEVYVYYNVEMLTPLVNAVLPRVKLKGFERAINEEWGAVQSFDHANLPPLPSPLPTWTPYPTYTRTPTWTPFPTSTRTSTATVTRTSTPTSTGTVTQAPTGTATLTNTPGPPTATATRTNTALPPTATFTSTPVPPTFTSTSTNTPLPPTATSTRTYTPVPPTATRTATATATPVKRLVITTVHLKKRLGSTGTLDIGIDLDDELGVAVDGATVTSSGTYTGNLPNVGTGLYGFCRIGSYPDPATNVTVTITASKAGYQSATVTRSATSGYDALCGP